MEDFLRKQKTEIIKKWSEEVRTQIGATDQSGHFELINTFPQFLDELEESLREINVKQTSAIDLARSHAKQRISIESYGVEEVIKEYKIMCDCLLEILDHDGQMTQKQKQIMFEFIKKSRNSASLEFLRLAERREKEAKLKAKTALQMIENLLASTPYGIGLLDLELKFEKINESLARLNGRSVADHLGKSIWEVLPDAAHQLVPALREVIHTGKTIYNIEYCLKLPYDQKEHHLLSTYFPVEDADRKVIGVGGFVIDNTEEKNTKEELKILFEAASTGKAVIDQSTGKILRVNQALCKMLGYTLQELLTIPLHKIVYRNELPESNAEKRYLVPLQKRYVRKDGEIFWGEVYMAPLPPTPEHPFREICTIIDISERKIHEQERERLIEELTRDRALLTQEKYLREQFVNTLSHDLRNPLAAANACVQLLLRDIDSKERVTNLGHKALTNLKRSDRMIQDLLDASRIRAGQGLKLEMDELDLVPLVQNITEEMSTVHGPRFQLNVPVSAKGRWNKNNLERAMENLIINAVKYGHSHSPIAITLHSLENSIQFSVHNFGNPIPQKEIHGLFDPFRRSKSAENSPTQGWGLGLTLVKGVADAHGGNVSVKSSEDKGTIFTITLPFDQK